MTIIQRDGVRAELMPLAPANGQNSIVNVAFSIEMDALPDAEMVAAFGALGPQLLNEGFDPGIPVTTFRVQVGVPQLGMPGQELGGYRYIKRNTAGQITREFSLQGNGVIVVVHDYSRWKQVWSEVQGLLLKCAPVLAASLRSVRSVAMQVTDRFTWRDVSPLPTKLILRPDAKYVIPAVLDQQGPWHSNFGFFTGVSDCDWTRMRLDNINLSVSEEIPFKSLIIFALYRYTAITSSRAPDNFVSDILPKLYNLAHDHNKELLRQLLTDDVQRLIKLDNH